MLRGVYEYAESANNHEEKDLTIKQQLTVLESILPYLYLHFQRSPITSLRGFEKRYNNEMEKDSVQYIKKT